MKEIMGKNLHVNEVLGLYIFVSLMSRIECKYCLVSTSHIWQGYLTFSYYFIFDRTVCVLVTFYQ